jgi:hypothetical protein
MFIKKMVLKTVAVGSLMVAFSSTSFAADKTPQSNEKMTSMSPELKSEMAIMYEKMGACMKTNKSMDECQKDVMKDCPVMAKTGHCPLMEGTRSMKKDMPMMMHKGMKGMSHPMGGDSMGNDAKEN